MLQANRLAHFCAQNTLMDMKYKQSLRAGVRQYHVADKAKPVSYGQKSANDSNKDEEVHLLRFYNVQGNVRACD